MKYQTHKVFKKEEISRRKAQAPTYMKGKIKFQKKR